MKKIAVVLSAVMVMCVTSGSVLAKSSYGMNDYINFTPEQITALADTATEHNAKMQAIIKKLEDTVEELVKEASKDDDKETPKKQRKNPKKIDKLIKEIAGLTGDMLKAKTEYLLKAKDVLTPEQKEKLVADLEYRVDYFGGESPFFFQLDDLSEILDLNTDQIKQILKHRTDMRTKELKMQMDVAYQILDIKEMLSDPEKKSGTVDEKVMKIADIGAKLLDNRISYMLKARKVLTKPQKQELRHLVLLNLHAFSLFD